MKKILCGNKRKEKEKEKVNEKGKKQETEDEEEVNSRHYLSLYSIIFMIYKITFEFTA